MCLKILLLILFTTSAFAEEECEIPGTPFQEVQNLLRAARDNCTEIQRGAFRIHNTLRGRANHLLERDSNGNYRATFNIDFKPQKGITTNPQFLREKMNACLKMVAPYLKGPDGNTITMRVLSPQETEALPDNQRPSKFKISIGAVGSRSNTLMFSSDDDCATFTHEMLHHMGLEDEYHEESVELAHKYNCRPETRDDSVMFTHTKGLESAVPRTVMCRCSTDACETLMANPDESTVRRLLQAPGWPMTQEFQRTNCTYRYSFLTEGTASREGLKVIRDNGDHLEAKFQSYHPDNIKKRFIPTEMTLTCTCRDDACRRTKTEMLAKIGQTPPPPTSCPSGFREASRELAAGTFRPGLHNGMLRYSLTPSRSTILYPNQFRRAVAGTCEENVAGYGMCAEYATTGSISGQCKTPQECRNPDFYIGPTPQ